MEGNECWTNAFGDRFGEMVCVGIEDGQCIHNGEKFRPTTQEKTELWSDFVVQELGSPSQIMRELEEESELIMQPARKYQKKITIEEKEK